MINNINTYSNLFNTNTSTSTSTSEVDDIISDYKKEQITAAESTNSSNTNLYLSSKAQKISAISNEFFSDAGLSFVDVDSLKERIYQLGLISKEEYSRLTQTELSDEEKITSNDMSTTGVTHYIGGFLTRLDAGDTENTEGETDKEPKEESESIIALREALTTAKTIIADVDKAKADPKFKESLVNSMALIKETINASAFEKMPLDDKVGLSKVYETLELVDKISPQRLTNEKLNKYMEVSFDY